MSVNLKYRDLLYTGYYSTQSGRNHTSLELSKFNEEKFQFTNEIIPLLQVDKTIQILDIGCGTGSLLAALKEKGYHAIQGIDISQEQVDIAHSLGMNEVICINLNDFLKQSNELFDVICGMDIIEHFTKDELVELLLLLKTKLKPSGKLIFRTPNLDAPFASIYAHGDFTHENFMNANSANQLLLATGFINITIQPALIITKGLIKEIIRKFIWFIIRQFIKIILFSSGRSTKGIVMTPNLLITARIE